MSTIVPSARQQLGGALAALWWIPLLRGVMLLALGGYALFQPALTAIALTQVLGIFIIADGAIAIAAALMGGGGSRVWTILRGVVGILVGTFVFAHAMVVAGVTATVLMYVIAAGMIVGGLLEIFVAIRHRKEIQGELWMIVGGVMAVVFGAVILAAPIAFSLLIVQIIAFYAMMFGFALITLAFRMRKAGKRLA